MIKINRVHTRRCSFIPVTVLWVSLVPRPDLPGWVEPGNELGMMLINYVGLQSTIMGMARL